MQVGDRVQIRYEYSQWYSGAEGEVIAIHPETSDTYACAEIRLANGIRVRIRLIDLEIVSPPIQLAREADSESG